MGLKEINEQRKAEISFTKVELASGKKIGVKPWRVKEEKELLFAVEGIVNDADGKREIVKFIRNCVDDIKLFDTLSNTDYIHLLSHLRRLSKGSKIEYLYKCNKCGFELSDDVDITKHMKVKLFKNEPIKISDNIIVSIKEVPFTKQDQLAEKYQKTAEYNFYYIINSIESLAYNGEVVENFNENEIVDFIDSLTSDELKKLSKSIDESAAVVTMEKKLKCGACKHENDVEFGDLYSFLAFAS